MKCELFNDNFQNFKRYQIPKAQLVIADIPYNIFGKSYAYRDKYNAYKKKRMELERLKKKREKEAMEKGISFLETEKMEGL